MLTVKKDEGTKRVKYSEDSNEEQITSLSFKIFDGSNQVGEGTISSGYPGMMQTGSITASVTVRNTTFTPEDIFSRIPVLLQEGGAE